MLLEPMVSRLASARSLDEVIHTGVSDVVALLGAEMGNIQFPAKDGRLMIVAARGVGLAFLETFRTVAMDSTTVCGRAATLGKPVFVADVTTDREFKPYLDFANSVPFRSVLSFPLISSTGELVGVVSAHSANIFKPTVLELQTAETYTRRLADAIGAFAVPSARAEYAEARSAELISRALVTP